jgi:DNA-binding MarR family transcriptional regulator
MYGMLDMASPVKSRDPDYQKGLRRALAASTVFQDEVNEHMPLQLAHTFLMVAMSEGKSLREYADMAGVAQSSMSRRLLDLGQKNRKNEPGYLLIDRMQDPMELRKNIYTLSPKGKLLAAKVVAAILGKRAGDTEGIQDGET